jgi:hypothetical protein
MVVAVIVPEAVILTVFDLSSAEMLDAARKATSATNCNTLHNGLLFARGGFPFHALKCDAGWNFGARSGSKRGFVRHTRLFLGCARVFFVLFLLGHRALRCLALVKAYGQRGR